MKTGIARSKRSQRLIAALAVIAVGLALRLTGYKLGLPFLFVKYGGSLLWGAMVYLLLAALSNSRDTTRLVLASVFLSACIEFFRLYHTPWLDAFRLTLPGQLLLGRIFSRWNILAYAAGIGLAAAWDRRHITPERGSAA